MQPDALTYLTNDTLRACTVYDYETDTTLPVYDLDAAGGTTAMRAVPLRVEIAADDRESKCRDGQELVVFRDSFGSSLVPLLAEGYARITSSTSAMSRRSGSVCG